MLAGKYRQTKPDLSFFLSSNFKNNWNFLMNISWLGPQNLPSYQISAKSVTLSGHDFLKKLECYRLLVLNTSSESGLRDSRSTKIWDLSFLSLALPVTVKWNVTSKLK